MSQFAFKRTGDADYPRHLKILLQGPPKSGKTTFIATAPNVVVAACEAGLASIAHLDVPYVEIDGTDKLQSLEMVLRDDTLRAQAAASLGLPKIESVAIDTLDAWQEMLKKEILAENKRSQMQQADWGTMKERMQAVLKRYVTLPINVIFTVHTSTTQDDEQRMIYAPALQGSIKDEIAGYVDFSLLSFRQRETDRQGVARINYYIKAEGDQKNPHLGNRAAGRLPEIVAPQFKTLHDGVFGHMQRAPRVGAEDPQPSSAPAASEPTPQVTAQTPSRTVAAPPVSAPPARPAPTGIPEDDSDAPINAGGVQMLSKSYTEHSFVVPDDLQSWTLGKARKVAQGFMGWKADKAAGQNVTRDDLTGLLETWDAWAGEMPGVQTGTQNLKAKPAEAAPSEEKSDADKETDAAIALVQDQLGAVEVVTQAADGANCEQCGKPVDDKDIANLAVIKFKKALCVADYKNAVKASKQ